MASGLMRNVGLFALLSLFVSDLSHASWFSEEKRTHLHFFFHDIFGGPSATAIPVAHDPSSTALGFGTVVIIDDALTEGPNLSSRLVGRAQGMYAIASKDDPSLLMAMNLAFVDGEFNGSSLAVLGRNSVLSAVREMPVVGGSGKFRLARGYALAKTYEFIPGSGNAIVEYDVYVMHH